MKSSDPFVEAVASSQALTSIGIHQQSDALECSMVVAVSGGADSVALLRALLTLGVTCEVAHCNYHLRGEESNRDELFVRQLCAQHSVPVHVIDMDVAAYQEQHGGSVEMACRELRYAWFEQLRQSLGCQYVAVGHHREDQVETLFLNLLRGTGLKGLAGMRALNRHIVRPLLAVSRQDIIDYLQRIDQDWVNDSTNATNDYQRNRIRHLVVPLLEQQMAGASVRIAETMRHLREDDALLDALIERWIPNKRQISYDTLEDINPHAISLLYHLMRSYGFNHQQCESAWNSRHQPGKIFQAPHATLTVGRHHFIVSDNTSEGAHEIEVPIDLRQGLISPIHLAVVMGGAPFSPTMCDGRKRIALSSQVLHCKHIVLRHWRKGDRIKPYGMVGSKLVSDVLADYKIERCDKHQVWLLEADGDILWVLGLRASRLYTVARESLDYVLLTIDDEVQSHIEPQMKCKGYRMRCPPCDGENMINSR